MANQSITSIVEAAYRDINAPATYDQIATATGLSKNQIREASRTLSKPNKSRPAKLKKIENGIYQVIHAPIEQDKIMSASDTVIQAMQKIQKPARAADIAKITGLEKGNVANLMINLTREKETRPARLVKIEPGLYKLREEVDNTDREATPTDSPMPHGLQTPPPVPQKLPEHTTSIDDFKNAQNNIQRLWLLHKSISESLTILHAFGDTIPMPQHFTDAQEAAKYADALKTYLVSTIHYQNALENYNKDPLKSIPTAIRQQEAGELESRQQEQGNENEQKTETEEKQEPINFTFAGDTFENIKALQNAIELIKTKAPLNKPLTGADQTILYQLLRYAQNYKEIIRGGILHFEVQLAQQNNPNSRTFALIKSDGNKTKISTGECIKRFKDGEKPVDTDTEI